MRSLFFLKIKYILLCFTYATRVLDKMIVVRAVVFNTTIKDSSLYSLIGEIMKIGDVSRFQNSTYCFSYRDE
jgi:hypothetical protein